MAISITMIPNTLSYFYFYFISLLSLVHSESEQHLKKKKRVSDNQLDIEYREQEE